MANKETGLKDKVTIITGAAGGIGQALAEAFSRHEAILVLADTRKRDLDVMSAILKSRSREVLSVEHDVREPESWQGLMSRVLARYGRIDILVNNAGVLQPGLAEELTLAEIEQQIAVNFWGTICGCQSALRIMKAQKFGKIINVASLGGIVPMPWVAVYSATKFAVRGYSLSLYAELIDSPVQVSVVCPDSVATPQLAHELTCDDAVMSFIGEPLAPAEAAERILAAALKDVPEILIPAGIGLFARTGMAFPRIFYALFPILRRMGRRNMEKMKGGKGKWQYQSMLP